MYSAHTSGFAANGCACVRAHARARARARAVRCRAVLCMLTPELRQLFVDEVDQPREESAVQVPRLGLVGLGEW